MGRRSGAVRSRPRDYIPFGAPEEVLIERVDHVYHNGRVKRVVWQERLSGTATSTQRATKKSGRDTGDLHQGCEGRKGVARLFWRDGEGWCHGCYVMKFGVDPYDDDLLEEPPATRDRDLVSRT